MYLCCDWSMEYSILINFANLKCLDYSSLIGIYVWRWEMPIPSTLASFATNAGPGNPSILGQCAVCIVPWALYNYDYLYNCRRWRSWLLETVSLDNATTYECAQLCRWGDCDPYSWSLQAYWCGLQPEGRVRGALAATTSAHAAGSAWSARSAGEFLDLDIWQPFRWFRPLGLRSPPFETQYLMTPLSISAAVAVPKLISDDPSVNKKNV